MPDNIGLIVAFALPVVALTLLRINAVMVFLSLCLGEVLVRFMANDANSMLNLFSSHAPSTVSQSSLKIVLLLLPAVLASLFLLFSVKGRGRVLLNILPAASASFLGIVLAVPLLAPGLRYSMQSHQLWQEFTQAQAMVVGVSAIVCVVFIWMQRSSSGGGKRHGR